jgi:hypothetical protein
MSGRILDNSLFVASSERQLEFVIKGNKLFDFNGARIGEQSVGVHLTILQPTSYAPQIQARTYFRGLTALRLTSISS